MSTLLVAGSRTFAPWKPSRMETVLDHASYTLDMTFDRVIHGGARGVDTMAGNWASFKQYPVEVFYAEWDTLGKAAGYARNAKMVREADAAIIVWDGRSRGTASTHNLCLTKGIPFVLVVRKP